MPTHKGFFAGSTITSAKPTSLIPQCGACGLFKGCHSPKMEPTGGGGRRILLVGEAPGENEDKEGTQFIGKAGVHLRRVLDKFDVHLDNDVWKTNTLICRPPNNRQPTQAEVTYCRPNLMRAIKELKPEIIIPLGGAAVQAVIAPLWREDPGKIGRWIGWRIPSQKLNAWVCPVWHPSYLLRQDDRTLDRIFDRHIEAATDLTGRPWANVPNWRADVNLITNSAKAAAWLRQVVTHGGKGAVAWDYETNMLKPDGPDARIVSCAVTWGRGKPERTMAFPWHGEAIKAMGELIRSPIPKIASNLKFEDRWTRKEFGHRVRNWVWDTMLAAHIADNRSGITSVKFQSFIRLGTPTWNDHIEPFLKTKGNEKINRILKEIDIRDLLLYNGLDALLEFRVAVDQIKELGYPKPWRM